MDEVNIKSWLVFLLPFIPITIGAIIAVVSIVKRTNKQKIKKDKARYYNIAMAILTTIIVVGFIATTIMTVLGVIDGSVARVAYAAIIVIFIILTVIFSTIKLKVRNSSATAEEVHPVLKNILESNEKREILAGDLDFEKVENARQEYANKSRAYSKKFRKTIGILIAVTVLIEIPIIFSVAFNEAIYSGGNDSGFRIIIAIPIVVFGVSAVVVGCNYYGKFDPTSSYKTYKHAYKEYFIKRQLLATFTDLQYQHNEGISQDKLENTGLIHTGDLDVYNSNDRTHGKYKKTEFTQADVKMGESSDDSINMFFVGRYLIFTFNKKINSRMAIVPRACEEEPFVNVGSKFKQVVKTEQPRPNLEIKSSFLTPSQNKFKQFETESTEFNQEFITYIEDDFEAFYILNPAFMENLYKLSLEHDHKIYICFANDKMFLGINDNNDFFEPPEDSNIPLDEQKELAKVNKEMSIITGIIDGLKLD